MRAPSSSRNFEGEGIELQRGKKREKTRGHKEQCHNCGGRSVIGE